ncbi:hypothetical protein DMI70_11165 [Escherichia coli]|nr:hypothetical protein [Escherichia coli]
MKSRRSFIDFPERFVRRIHNSNIARFALTRNRSGEETVLRILREYCQYLILCMMFSKRMQNTPRITPRASGKTGVSRFRQ